MNNLHITLTPFKNETRVLKVTKSLVAKRVFSRITIAALHEDGLAEQEVIDTRREVFRIRLRSRSLPTSLPFQLLKFVEFGWRALVLVARQRPRVVNVHALTLLPLGVLIKVLFRTVLVYDAHELETEVDGLVGFRKRLLKLVERLLIHSADAICVVNQTIADWYRTTYGVNNVSVVQNVPYKNLTSPVRRGLLRRAIGLDAESMLFIYQGMLSQGRGIELLLDIFAQLGTERHLVLMGYGPLKELVASFAARCQNIHFVPAVAPDQVKDYTVDADVGLAVIENKCLSYYLCTPNKMYEYASCGVPMIVSDFPEMGRFVDEFQCGWKVAVAHESLWRLISDIGPADIQAKKLNIEDSNRVYCWEHEEQRLFEMYADFGLKPWTQTVAQDEPTCATQDRT